MPSYKVEVRVWLKPSVFDPQGSAVEHALQSLGYDGVGHIRIGKYMELQVTSETEQDAEAKVRVICDTVLCNPVMETYAFTMQPIHTADDAGLIV